MIKKILLKHGFNDTETNNHYLSILKRMPQNEWFAPNNKNDEEFTICSWFASRGIICEKRVPLFINGSYTGMKLYYLWNDELNYSEI